MKLSGCAADPNQSADQGLAVLIEELTAKLQASDPASVEAYLESHPEYADRLRRLLPTLNGLAALGQPALSENPTGEPSETFPVQPCGELGDFRLLREVGRGGMGVVYEAEQISLGRRIALKVPPFAAAMDSKRLQRFKNEAQAAAHLHHQHIVPVHAVGCERGVHFYAMQFIDGVTLAGLIRELREQRAGKQAAAELPPTAAYVSEEASAAHAVELRADHAKADTVIQAALSTQPSTQGPALFALVATLGIQAAEALKHAHDQGVIHRDIKPANLLLDGRGQLWVTDFGLAQFNADAGLTMTGDLMGTMRYMSPEQAMAKRVVIDHRTDVYCQQALRAVLYRSGQFAEALKQLTAAINAPDKARTSVTYNHYFLAMIHHRLGHRDEARQWFDKAAQATKKMLGEDKTEAGEAVPWNRRLTLELLHAEAETLLGVTEKTEAKGKQ